MKEYSVREFAALAGVSPSAIYQQVGNPKSKIQPYIDKRDNQTYIKESALYDLYKLDKPECEGEISQPLQTNQDDSSQDEAITADYIAFLKEQIAKKDAIISQKDTIIAQKEAIITEQASQIQAQHTELQALSQQLIDISKNALSLAAGQQTLTALDKGVKPESQAILDYSQDDSSLEVKPVEKKHGWLYNFFFG